jgi:cell wall-associated NlpC family hydrolase
MRRAILSHPVPEDLDRVQVDGVLRHVRGVDRVADRIGAISGMFMGRPYVECPLGGSPGGREPFRAGLDGFDCVTYIESVLALAVSRDSNDFADQLCRIRYVNGVLDWSARNHYMTGWIRENVRSGLLIDRIRGSGLVERERILDVVEGLKPRRVRVRSLPKREFIRQFRSLRSGDLVFFASTRRHRDVFHCGVAVVDGVTVLLRHAARSQGRVVEQTMNSFLNANRMTGVMLVRARER